MVLLLDTHILLWALSAPGRLPLEVVNQIEIPENEVYFSAVSIWEIAIKTALRKVDFPYPPRRIAQAAREAGFMELSITSEQTAEVATLPFHHHDPFDRLLIAQALLMPSRLLTADFALEPYSELVWLIR
jgi:PIN domain nuclease of toxin-antitoxin system